MDVTLEEGKISVAPAAEPLLTLESLLKGIKMRIFIKRLIPVRHSGVRSRSEIKGENSIVTAKRDNE